MPKMTQLRNARYQSVIAKILNIGIKFSGMSPESRAQLEDYVDDSGYVRMQKVPMEELEKYFLRAQMNFAMSSDSVVTSRKTAVIPVSGPKGSAIICAEEVTVDIDPEKMKESQKRMDRQYGKETMGKYRKDMEEIMKILESIETDEEWKELYKKLDSDLSK